MHETTAKVFSAHSVARLCRNYSDHNAPRWKALTKHFVHKWSSASTLTRVSEYGSPIIGGEMYSC